MRKVERTILASGIVGLVYCILAFILEMRGVSFKVELSWVFTCLAFAELVKMICNIKDI